MNTTLKKIADVRKSTPPSYRSIFEDHFGGFGRNLFLLDDFFGRSSDFVNDVNFPKYNILSTEKGMKIEVALAGYKKEDLSVELDKDNILSVSSTKSKDTEDSGVKYHRREVASRSFNVSWNIGPNMEVGDVEFVDGMLSISLNTKEPEKPEVKRLTIK
jgi:molecular chaperone IbpA